MNYLLIFFLKICTIWVCYGQILSSGVGLAEFSGENGVNRVDAFSVFNNPANLQSESLVLGLSAKNYHQIDGLYQFVLSGQAPTKFANIGFGLSRYGDDLFHESMVNLGFGKQIAENLSLGISLNYISVYAEYASNASTIIPQLGLSYHFSDAFQLGVQSRNPLQQEMDEPWDKNLNSTFSIGLLYQPTEEFLTSIQTNIESIHGLQVGIGIEYLMFKQVKMCIGGQTNPGKLTAGLIVPLSQFKLGLGGQYQDPLGISPQVVIENQW